MASSKSTKTAVQSPGSKAEGEEVKQDKPKAGAKPEDDRLARDPRTATAAENVTDIHTAFVNGIHTLWQALRIFYKFLCLLYQYPNASHIAIQAAYKSLKLLYQTGLWDPLHREKAEAAAEGKVVAKSPNGSLRAATPETVRKSKKLNEVK
ncbi:unnamed protein product [Bursaphelenchus okinawaensis]|uniref:Uncharacterized protein n=1 Tax=Bursaphelenchus okinawaensis TaxID=465554 RepID=A0A811K4Q8_9BILA|nr:unnamed protein product [Bursaphelenchus okinawaensis]CAG9090662.1 unnamed protein product [Bursaphelenchus okinawaensis]